MSTFFLQQGLVIRRSGEYLEYSARTTHEIYFEDPMTGHRVTLTETQFWVEFQTQRISIIDAFSSPKQLIFNEQAEPEKIQSLEMLPEQYRQKIERMLQYIWALRKSGITRGQKNFIEIEAKKIAKNIGDELGPPGTSTIQRYWAKYEKHHHDVFVLINTGNKGARSYLDRESEQFLQKMIDEKYAIRTRPSITGSYRDYEKAIKDENKIRSASGDQLLIKISARTFENRIKERPKEEMMVARFGREAARHHFKMIKGHLPSEHPLDAVEIDHTPTNLYVIDDLTHLPLGRAFMTAIKDRYSGVLLGFYLTFRPPGLHSIFGCIKHSLCSHHLAYELWPDIQNPWPSFGLGATYVSDRGADFLSPKYRHAIISLGAEYEYCERRTPWLKGSIERYFLTVEQNLFELLPGRTFSNLRLRGDYDPAEDSVIRFSTLVYLLHRWAADYHNIQENSRKLARPLDLWMEGIGLVPPPYPKSPDHLNIILGEHYEGRLSHEGIRHKGMTYADDFLNDLMRDIGKGVKLDFVVTHENMGSIHVLDPRTKSYVRVSNTRPEYAEGLSSFQHNYLRKEAKVRLDNQAAIDSLIETRARIAEVTQQELYARKSTAKSQLARVAGINSNSVLEGNPRSIQDPFYGQDVSAKNVVESELILPKFTDVAAYKWGI